MAIPAVSVDYRQARHDDVPAVVELVESAYRGEPSRAGWTTEADLIGGRRTDAASVAELVDRPGSVVVLGEAVGGTGRRLLGCFHLERRDAATAYFGMFAVSPAVQGGGIGRALVSEARRRASEWGRARIRMTVIRQRGDLLDWYRRLGFEPTGETEPFPYGDERFGRPLRDDLEFLVLEGSTGPFIGE